MHLATFKGVGIVVIRAKLSRPVRKCIQIGTTRDIDIAMWLMEGEWPQPDAAFIADDERTFKAVEVNSPRFGDFKEGTIGEVDEATAELFNGVASGLRAKLIELDLLECTPSHTENPGVTE